MTSGGVEGLELPASSAPLYHREKGNGPPVLFIHGTGADADIWGEAYDLVARSCRAIAYDRRGFSRSVCETKVRHYRKHVADAAELLERLDATPATLVGWSSGGVIALELALSRPDLVAGLVLVESVSVQPSTLTLRAMAMMLEGKARQIVTGDRRAAEWFYRWATAYKRGGNGFDAMPAALREAELANASASMSEIQNAWSSARHQTRQRLGTISKPTLTLISGGSATGGWYERVGRFMASSIPNARLETIPGACHAMFRDDPERFAQLVVEAAHHATAEEISPTAS